jgi:acyl-coenzyme A synthetase/AMP-(fatty) acid ligase
VHVIDAIPMSAVGKILRRALRSGASSGNEQRTHGHLPE